MPPQLDGPVIQIPDPPEEPPEPEVVEPVVEPALEEVQQAEESQDGDIGEESGATADLSSEPVEAELELDESDVAEVHQISAAEEPGPVVLAEGDSIEVSSTVVRRRRKAGSADTVEE